MTIVRNVILFPLFLTPLVASVLPASVLAQAALRPVLECVDDNGDGTYTAHFGYKNDDIVNVVVPAGSDNRFTPAPQDRGQSTDFLPGRQVRVFSIDFDGNNLVWTLRGPNGQTRTATASSNPAQRCAAPAPTPVATPVPFFRTGDCPTEPQAGCKVTTKSRKAFIYVRTKDNEASNRVVWNWAKGEAVEQNELGDPLTDTSFTLCAYDTTASGTALAFDFKVAAGAGWESSRKGYKFRDREGANDGVQMMRINRGDDGAARVTVVARGAAMGLPRAQPRQEDMMVVQFWNSEGTCWTSEFTAAAAKRRATVFADYGE